jgi:transcriptional regulator with GAF, ATPase, and Fis domain
MRENAMNDSYEAAQVRFGEVSKRAWAEPRPIRVLVAPAKRATAPVVGRSRALEEVMSQVAKVAGTDSTVLIQGETGTGKELIAQAIHESSRRSEGPFVRLNAAAVPANLLESELFGHERGAFTGALVRRLGRFELAQGGTLFLDEIGELAPELQPKLLRVLQERSFERVGGTHTIASDVRLIAATNRDLGELVRASAFRADLYYRLSVFPIEMPPLRERREDIALLAAHFVERLARDLGKPGLSLSPEALCRLERQAWPGNVRQLQNVLERAAILATGTRLEIELEAAPVPQPEPSELDLEAFIRARLLPGKGELYRLAHQQVDRLLLTLAVEHTQGNYRNAARLLGMSRQTLRMKLRALGLNVRHTVRPEADFGR